MTEAVRKPSRVLRVLKWIGLGLVGLILLLLIVGSIWEQIERSHARKAYPMRGQLVDIGGRKMHIDCRGSGTPTVIFEAGLDSNGSLAWDSIHDTIAKQSRACAYDRAGVMWSDPTPGKQDAEKVADDLHAMLTGAQIDGPIVLVGHSLGGPYIMTYVRKYGEQVKGLVFVDTSHPDQLFRNTPKMMEMSKKQDDSLFWPTLMSKTSWTGALRAITSFTEKEPRPGVAARTQAMGDAYMPQTLEGSMKEAASLSEILAQGGKLRDLGDRPLVVLTQQKPVAKEFATMGMSAKDADDFLKQWKILQAEEASWSTRSRQIVVGDSGHYVQHERPDLVIGAIEEVLAAVRGDATKLPVRAKGEAAPVEEAPPAH